NSSGAVILFVYLLICVSQIVLRYRRDGAELTVRMWLFPWLSGLTTLAILGVLVQMAFDAEVRIQLWLSLLSWAAFLVLFVVNRVRLVRVDRVPERVGG
ncbi:hypothetical protein, partial [Nocardioides panacihumi]|uniref:hypothetical protein n=1 Tax=Nocardioides panacihumi TaxID=400774 RepID=UPI003CD07906